MNLEKKIEELEIELQKLQTIIGMQKATITLISITLLIQSIISLFK